MHVIYVAGSMRSGTTLVAELLGSYGNSVAVGEVNNIWRVPGSRQACSCGAPWSNCPLWAGVLQTALSEGDPKRIEGLRRAVERQRRVPELLGLIHRPRRRWPPDVTMYVQILEQVMRAISSAGCAEVIVDSSKSPAGFALMRLAMRGEVSMVHVVRDPRAVAYAEAKSIHTGRGLLPHRRNIVRSVADWSVGNATCVAMRKHAKSYHYLSYEEMCRAPERRMSGVADAMGLAQPGPRWSGDEVELGASHILVGNPERSGPRIRRIVCDEGWRTNMRATEQFAVRALALPGRSYLAFEARHSTE